MIILSMESGKTMEEGGGGVPALLFYLNAAVAPDKEHKAVKQLHCKREP